MSTEISQAERLARDIVVLRVRQTMKPIFDRVDFSLALELAHADWRYGPGAVQVPEWDNEMSNCYHAYWTLANKEMLFPLDFISKQGEEKQQASLSKKAKLKLLDQNALEKRRAGPPPLTPVQLLALDYATAAYAQGWQDACVWGYPFHPHFIPPMIPPPPGLEHPSLSSWH